MTGVRPPGATSTLYRPVEGVIVRAPALPVERYLAIGNSLNGTPDPTIRLAVRIASDVLSAELDRPRDWDRTPAAARDARRRTAAVLRYAIRCSTRPTPYGMFAGVAVGTWAATTDVRIGAGPRPVRARPDMGWLMGVVLDLEDLLRPHLRLVANTCAFERDGRVHLADRTAGGGADGPDVSVRATGAVRRVLTAARVPYPYQDLVSHLLATTPGATVAQARGLIDELCGLDFLLTDLRPPLAGRPFDHLLRRVAAIPGAGHLAEQLSEAARLTAEVEATASAVPAGQVPGDALAADAETDRAMDTAVEGAVEAAIDAVGRFRDRLPGIAASTSARAGAVRGGRDRAGRHAGVQYRRGGPRSRTGSAGRPTDVLQVDSALPLAAGAVGRSVAADAALAVDLLLRMHPAPGGPRHLSAYRSAFLRRYGPARRVPLLELLDPRFGLGPLERWSAAGGAGGPAHGGAVRGPYGRGADGGQPAGAAIGGAAANRHAAAERADRLWELATRPPDGDLREAVLTDDDVRALSLWRPDPRLLAPSVELSAFVLATSAAAVDRGDYLLMVGPNLGAQEAGRGLGRFADLLGAASVGLLRQIIDLEEDRRGGVPAAELVYLPRHHRSANVAVREPLRGLEIPVGVSPGVDGDRVVAADELSVLVRDGRLRVWWERAGREIAITAGHMLNAAAAPEVCRFLHDVGMDGRTGLAPFDWGPAAALPVLPRVRHGRVVLRPACWRHRREHAARALRVDEPAAFPDALRRWRARWRLPRRVYLAAGDNRLLLDLDDRDQADLLRAELRGGPPGGGPDLVLQEALPGPEHAWVTGPGGRYVSELVVPMVRRQSDRPAPAATGPGGTARGSVAPAPATQAEPADGRGQVAEHERADRSRLRPPGSDWLYVVLAGPVDAQGEIIAGPLRALADGLLAAGQVDRWFFIRYADPEPHLRLRLHGDPAALRRDVLGEVMAQAADLIAAGRLRRAAIETYERELERYGGLGAIDLAEAVFAADSRAVADVLGTAAGRAAAPGPGGGLLALAAANVATLLDGLGLDEDRRLDWYSEYAPPPRESAAAHRRHGTLVDEWLRGTGQDFDSTADAGARSAAAAYEEPRSVLARRTAALRPLGEQLRRLHAEGTCQVPLETLARSFVHMSCNRLGVDPSSERIVLGLLRRNAHSRRARERERAPRRHGRSAALQAGQAGADVTVLGG